MARRNKAFSDLENSAEESTNLQVLESETSLSEPIENIEDVPPPVVESMSLESDSGSVFVMLKPINGATLDGGTSPVRLYRGKAEMLAQKCPDKFVII